MALTADEARRAPRRQTRRRRRGARVAAALAMVVAIVAGCVIAVRAIFKPGPPTPECIVHTGDTPFTLDLDQAGNAATIAGVGKARGLPDHAVTVALAAAFQESNLHNLSYGDRDSLGLFQQRPSQGWGTPDQLTTPSYAAAAFYRELEKVHGWQTLAVTDAAQRVQRSGAPSAYAKWEQEARALAIALTGEQPATFTCRFSLAKHATGYADPAPVVQRELGIADVTAPLEPATAWTAASWLVAHAREYGITSIRLRGQRWTAASGQWKPDAKAGARLDVTQAR